MGVIYKLKDEIVQFILQQKQTNPAVSCRKLVDLIQETFHISVSKSSINTIIKEAHLSNPVGRTRIKSKTSAFKIPQEKKSELLEKTKSSLRDVWEETPPPPAAPIQAPLPPFPPSPTPISPAEDVLTPPPEIEAEKDQANEGPAPQEEMRLSLLPDPLAVPSSISEDFQNVILQTLFFRFALWDLARRPILETFFKHQSDFSDEEIKIVDILLCMEDSVFAQPQLALRPEYAWLWFISGFETPPSAERLQEIIRHLETIKVSGFDFLIEISYFFEFVFNVKLCLRDNSVIHLDSRITQMTARNVTQCPMDRSVEAISQFMTDRSRPIILQCPSLPEAFQDFKNFIGACLCVEAKQIEKILLCDQDGKTLSEFHEPSCFDRKYVLVSQLTRVEMKELFGMDPLTEQIEQFGNGEERISFICKDLNVNIDDLQVSIRMIVFSTDITFQTSHAIFVLPEEPNSPQTLYNFTNFPQPIANNNLSETQSLLSESWPDHMTGCLANLKKKIEQYARENFNLLENIENERISLKIEKFNDEIIICIKNESIPKHLIKNNIRNINNYKICNYQQKSLKIIINNRQLD